MPAPRRTHRSNGVLALPGGTEDNDLWVERRFDDGKNPVICSTWEFTEEERKAIADGDNLTLIVWGQAQPPVAMAVDDVKLGKKPAPPPPPKKG